jgi:hypothetical protein
MYWIQIGSVAVYKIKLNIVLANNKHEHFKEIILKP